MSATLLLLAAALSTPQSHSTPVLDHASTRTSTEGEIATVQEFWQDPVDVRTAANRAGQSLGSAGLSALVATGTAYTVNQDPEGDMPRDVAFHPGGDLVGVACRDTDHLMLYSSTSHSLVAMVPVGDFPVHVDFSPNGQFAALPCVFDNAVALVNLSTLAVQMVPITGEQPFWVHFSSDSSRLFAGVITDGSTSRVSEISVASASETASFATVPAGSTGFFLTPESGIFGNLFTSWAITPDDSRLVLPDGANDQVAVYDLASHSQLALLPGSDWPAGVDISTDGTTAVVAYMGTAEQVGMVDLTSNSLSLLAPAVDITWPAVRITPDKSHAIVSVLNAVSFVNLSTGAVPSTVSTGTVGDIEISYDGQYAMVSNFNTRVISLATMGQLAVIPFAACADAAASPVAHRFVALNNRFREDLQFYNTSGAATTFDHVAMAGQPVECDAPRAAALTADGHTALVAGNTSDNVALVDMASGSVLGYVPTGNRTLEVATSPAGGVAVAVNSETNTATVIDTDAQTVLATLNVPSRPGNVVISPDGSQAFVLSVAGSDQLHFINLAGAASSVTGSLLPGQTGSILYTFNVISGMAVSPDGSLLAVCISFDDILLLVDTQTHAIVAQVPVGDFPIQVTFSPDSQFAYVTNSFSDTVSKVAVNQAVPAVVGTAVGIDFPLDVVTNATGDYLYVASFGANRVYAVRTSDMAVPGNLFLGGAPRSMELMQDQLFVTQTDSWINRIVVSGSSLSLIESEVLSGSPAAMVFSPALGTALTTDPGASDFVNLVRFGGIIGTYCDPINLNSAGEFGSMYAEGTFLAGGYPLRLVAGRLSLNNFGYFLVGQSAGSPVIPPGSQGTFCLSGFLGRFNQLSQIGFSGTQGAFHLDVDTLAIPLNPTTQILAGQTWNFQCWYRDQNPGNTSNFTNAIAISFE
ncbi:MAG: hypothetical protein R3F33_14265 [Planctomycetota bacterium]